MTGTLILVVGPSGVGKDTLLAGAQTTLIEKGFVFPRRIITRPEDAGGEDHVAVTPADFEWRKGQMTFVLSWSAHGNSYGIPVTITDDLAVGRHVVVNVSRTVIDEAIARFEHVGVVAISAPRDVRAARLNARGREDTGSIAGRIDRVASFDVGGPGAIEVINDGTVDDGIARIVAAIETAART